MPRSSVPAHLASTFRGDAIEAIIRGHVVVADGSGAVLASAGDAAAATTLRSCVKPLQALPFVRRGAAAIAATTEDIAIACASHAGDPVHVAAVRALLGRAGIAEELLSCGPQLPSDDASARDLLSAGGEPLPIHNNCSGKHAGMLAACRAAGWPLDGYAAYDHPLQAEVRAVMSEFAGTDLGRRHHGIDGCGLPTHELPLATMAAMFAAAASDPDLQRCQDAMAAHPHLVAGSGRLDTVLLEAAGMALTVKIGGAAVWVALRRPAGPALAIKLEAGDATAMPAVALAALTALGWLDRAAVATGPLAALAQPALRNWAGAEVGVTRAEVGWAAALAG